MSKVIQTVEELDAVLHWRNKHAVAIKERDALQERLTAADEQIDLLSPRHTEQPEGKRERFEKWVMATKHPVYGFVDGRSLARGDDRTGYADEYVQGLWVAYLAFGAEQPAPVAVAYQYRQRPLWRKDDNSGCMPWQDCSQEAHADYTASPDLHDWQYETRTLYAGPNQH